MSVIPNAVNLCFVLLLSPAVVHYFIINPSPFPFLFPALRRRAKRSVRWSPEASLASVLITRVLRVFAFVFMFPLFFKVFLLIFLNLSSFLVLLNLSQVVRFLFSLVCPQA